MVTKLADSSPLSASIVEGFPSRVDLLGSRRKYRRLYRLRAAAVRVCTLIGPPTPRMARKSAP